MTEETTEEERDLEYERWLKEGPRKPSLKIRVEPFADREQHAAELVAAEMKKIPQMKLPLIPAVDEAHLRVACYECGNSAWKPRRQAGMYVCDSCREAAKREEEEKAEAS